MSTAIVAVLSCSVGAVAGIIAGVYLLTRHITKNLKEYGFYHLRNGFRLIVSGETNEK